MDVTIVGNFSTSTSTIDPNFQNSGTWYDYFSGLPLEIASGEVKLALAPGQFHIFTSKPLETPKEGLVDFSLPGVITGIEDDLSENRIAIYPNPTQGNFKIQIKNTTADTEFSIRNITGKKLMEYQLKLGRHQSGHEINISGLPNGLYLLEIKDNTERIIQKIIKN